VTNALRQLRRAAFFPLPALLASCGGAPIDSGEDGPPASGGAYGSGGHVSQSGGSSAGGAGTGGGAHAGGAPGTGGVHTGGSGGASSGGSPGAETGGTSNGGLTGGLPPDFGLEFVGNITTSNGIDFEGMVYSDYWDQITPENAGKWGSVQSNAGAAFNWSTLDAIYDYAEEKGIIFKQHAFVWGSQQPGGNPSAEQVETWVQTFCERYPNTKLIDVVNEPPPHTNPNYTDALGGGTNTSWQWVTTSFEMAREHCPGAILLLNDFNNIEWDNDTNHFIGIVDAIQAAGAPIDAIGAQAHDLDNGQVSFQKVQGLIQKLHDETGLPIYITEFDISTTNDQQQLDLYEQYMPFFRETEYVRAVTIWGWIYGRTWNSAPQSGLVRDGAPRPAMTWLMDWLGRPSP